MSDETIQVARPEHGSVRRADVNIEVGGDGDGRGRRSRVDTAVITPAVAEPGLSELFRDLAQEGRTLIEQEVALAKAELKESVTGAVGDAVKAAIWGGVALVGGLVLTAFLVLLIGMWLASYWLSALIVGVVFVALGGGLAMRNVNKLRRAGLNVSGTRETLREDRDWARSEAQRVRRNLAS